MDVLQLLSDHLNSIIVFLAAFIGHVVLGARDERKEKKGRRAAAIARWRAEIDQMDWWIGADFQDSSVYSEIKRFLPTNLRQELEQGRGALTAPPSTGTLVEGESTKQKLLDEITRIEREVWKLL